MASGKKFVVYQGERIEVDADVTVEVARSVLTEAFPEAQNAVARVDEATGNIMFSHRTGEKG
jgi:hypothetical protein